MIHSGVDVLKAFIKTAPRKPGIYKIYTENNQIIYVGKAKNLKSRLQNYTQINNLPQRLKLMVSLIRHLEVIETKTEMEALLLECSFIKSLRPPFNILFKDDKSYAYIEISSKHPYPRLVKYRGEKDPDKTYFGPYPIVSTIDETIVYLQKLFQIRNCTDQEFERRKRPCLQYFIKRCTAPCVNYIDEKTYENNLNQAKKFLEGKSADVQNYLKEKMLSYSENLDFEKAASYRDKLTLLAKLESRKCLNINDADIFYFHAELNKLTVTQMIIRYGRQLGAQNLALEYSEAPDIVDEFLIQFYTKYQPAKSIYINKNPENLKLLEDWLYPSTIHIVKDDNVLMNLAQHKSQSKAEFIFYELGQYLKHAIQRIECYDNSHIHGKSAYGVMVVADHTGVNKSQYRKFGIKTVEKGNDYGMMREVLERRFQHTEWQFPDVLIVDGGKGQMHIAESILRGLNIDIPVIGIAKGEGRKNERFYVKDETELILEKESPIRYFLLNLRDEAHRFAITAHRKKHNQTTSVLDTIPGLGPQRKKLLLQHFGSIKAIKEASQDDMQLVKGISKPTALKIWQFFHQEK